jgi:hypothetical protein
MAMRKKIATVITLACALIDGCSVDQHDMRQALPLNSCKAFEGEYSDEKDYYRPYSGLPKITLWDFLTTQREDNPWILPCDETVLITNCAPTGFDATLFTSRTPGPTVHVTASYIDGFYYINQGPKLRNDWFVINSISNFSLGLGMDGFDGGLFVVAKETALGFILIIPGGGQVAIDANASFLPTPRATALVTHRKS